MGDVGKRPAVYKGWRIFRCLYKIRVEGISQQHGNGTGYTEVFHAEVLAVGSNTQHDVLNTPLQVFLAGSQTEYGHQFGGWRDVEPRLRYHPVASQTRHHIAQRTVVHVEHALPVYLTQREAVLAVLVDIVVEQGADGVVGRGYGMEVACEVQVYLLHWQHLGIAATGSTALDAEAGA